MWIILHTVIALVSSLNGFSKFFLIHNTIGRLKSAYSLHRTDCMSIIGQSSLLKSMAGETTELAKPVIGTSVPAPAKRAMEL